MFTYQPSIAQKIKLGYYVIGSIFISLIIINFIGLRHMEKKIAFDEAISRFSSTILEIRRCEKNFFLYSDESDYQENRKYIAKAQQLLKDNLHEFTALVLPVKIELLENSIEEYIHLMERYHGLEKVDILETGMNVTFHRRNLEKDIKK